MTEEKRALDEEERRASEEFIQRLLAEEEQLQQEDRRRSEDDEKLARLLSNQLVSVPSLRVIGGLVRVRECERFLSGGCHSLNTLFGLQSFCSNGESWAQTTGVLEDEEQFAFRSVQSV